MQGTSTRFRSEQFFICETYGEMIYQNIQQFVWRWHVGAHPDGHQHGRKPAVASVTDFATKS